MVDARGGGLLQHRFAVKSDAEPGSLAYYGGGRWHRLRIEAQATLEPYLFDNASAN